MEQEINNLIKTLKENNGLTTKDISDGYHTFGELYYHRAVLFSVICNTYKDKAWKSKKHHDGTMFGEHGEMFIVGIKTPEGQYSYHYNMPLWDLFEVEELEYAPGYDGHVPEDVSRLFSLLDTNPQLETRKTKFTLPNAEEMYKRTVEDREVAKEKARNMVREYVEKEIQEGLTTSILLYLYKFPSTVNKLLEDEEIFNTVKELEELGYEVTYHEPACDFEYIEVSWSKEG